MQVTETLNEGLKRGYKMILSAQALDDKVNEKLKEAQPDVELKGFRKGKVPLPLLVGPLVWRHSGWGWGCIQPRSPLASVWLMLALLAAVGQAWVRALQGCSCGGSVRVSRGPHC